MNHISVRYDEDVAGNYRQFLYVDGVLQSVFVTCEKCESTIQAPNEQLAESRVKIHECKDTNWDHDKRMYVGYAFGLNRFF